MLAITNALRDRLVVPDEEFDLVFPSSQRIRSSFHWTPIEIALRACELLDAGTSRRVLDIGSGVGKLCLVGALATTSTWCGIERNPAMVRAAIAAASRIGVEDRVHFVLGEISDVTWSDHDAFYMFNPFAERLFTTELDPMTRREVYYENIELVQRQLSMTKPGTRVVTYHGFGSDHIPGFDLVHREPARESELCLWIHQ